MPAGVGVYLRPVQPDRPHFQQAHLAGELQHLDEQLFNLVEEPSPEGGDRVVVGMFVPGDEAESHGIPRRPLHDPKTLGCRVARHAAFHHCAAAKGDRN